MTINEKYGKTAEIISQAGGTPLPVSDTLIKLLKYFIMEDEVDFIASFSDKKSQTMEQLKLSSGLPEEEINRKVKNLAGRGVIFNQPNSKGVMVFRLLPLFNVGTFEYNFMGKLEVTDRNKEIASLFNKLFADLEILIQANYDAIIPMLMAAPPVDRTAPVLENKPQNEPVKIVINEELEAAVDRIVPSQRVEELIQKFDEIALGHCFCRHYKDLEGAPCKQTSERETCFTFGKSARFTSEQGFSRMISKDEALTVLKRAEEAGLVHKAYHPNFDTSKDETSICNCCRCCCGNAVDNMMAPIANVTNFLSVVNDELCIGCGTCFKKCHTYAAYLTNDKKAGRKEEICIGCGVCAHFCPQNAISMVKGKQRIVRILPKRKQTR
ncbi:MAG: Ion-translocating oxidoreductase complex subunit B [Syntrophus sp. SKADARSKE-3]|nr:Ion-translocating oxidoreductase complex subunit B [Syntrophus sp. SKADARSKE-3]